MGRCRIRQGFDSIMYATNPVMTTIELPLTIVQANLYEAVSDLVDGYSTKEAVYVHTDKEHRVELERLSFSYVPDAVELFGVQARIAQVLFRMDKRKRVSCADATNDAVLYGTTAGDVILQRVHLNVAETKKSHALHTQVARISPSGNRAVSAGMDYSANVYDLAEPGKEPICVLIGQKGMLADVAFSDDSSRLYTLCASDCSLWSWGLDTDNGRSLRTPEDSRAVAVSDAAGLLIAADGLYKLNADDKFEMIVDIPSVGFVRTAGNLVAYASLKRVYVCHADNLNEPLMTLCAPAPVLQIELTPQRVFVRTEPSIFNVDLADGKYELLAGECTCMAVSESYVYLLSDEVRRFTHVRTGEYVALT